LDPEILETYEKQPDVQAELAEEQAETAASIARVREVIRVRRKRAQRGSAREAVLRYFEDIKLGKMTLTEVAKASGLAVSSLSRALGLERQEIAREVRATRRNPA